MCPILRQCPILQHQNQIRMRNRRQPMRNNQERLFILLPDLLDGLEDFGFGAGVEGGGGFVEEEDAPGFFGFM